MLHRFDCQTSPLAGGFHFGTMWDHRDLPFPMESRGVYVTNASSAGGDKAFAFAYETPENRTGSRVGRVNACRWDGTAISSTAAVVVIGF